MTLFKDFLHKITKGLLVLFVMSLSIGAMDKINFGDGQLSDDLFLLTESEPQQSKIISQIGGVSPDKGYNIDWKEISFKKKRSSSINFENARFCVKSSSLDDQRGFVPLFGIKTNSVRTMRKVGYVDDQEIQTAIKNNTQYSNINYWDAFIDILGNYTSRKRIAGEAAAVALFDHLNYIPLPAQNNQTYRNAYFEFNSCNTQNGSNQGIDGIFIHRSERDSQKKSHIIINEAKFSGNSTLRFGVKFIDNHTVSQSHSQWNKANFSLVNCIGDSLGQFDQQTIIRTATLLDGSGQIKLYDIKDEEDGTYDNNPYNIVRKTYASQASSRLHLHHVYTQFQQNVSTKGYTLH
jgi:hypothetical protein